VRRLALRPWLVICLVFARLLVGAPVHAEHAQTATDEVAALASVVADAQGAPCADHAGADASGPETQTPTSEGSDDCCQDGGCDCPCAHATTCVAAAMLAVHPALEQSRTDFTLRPLPAQRLAPLLRPPA
jgi:hypothetical protein